MLHLDVPGHHPKQLRVIYTLKKQTIACEQNTILYETFLANGEKQ